MLTGNHHFAVGWVKVIRSPTTNPCGSKRDEHGHTKDVEFNLIRPSHCCEHSRGGGLWKTLPRQFRSFWLTEVAWPMFRQRALAGFRNQLFHSHPCCVYRRVLATFCGYCHLPTIKESCPFSASRKSNLRKVLLMVRCTVSFTHRSDDPQHSVWVGPAVNPADIIANQKSIVADLLDERSSADRALAPSPLPPGVWPIRPQGGH
jgi:hypothetical protein